MLFHLLKLFLSFSVPQVYLVILYSLLNHWSFHVKCILFNSLFQESGCFLWGYLYIIFCISTFILISYLIKFCL